MSLSFSIDRILSPDFGPCKSRAFDSTTHTCSVNDLSVDTVQDLCKSYQKLVADTCKNLEMPPSTETQAEAALLSEMISAYPKLNFLSTDKSKWDVPKNVKTDISTYPTKHPDRNDLESLRLLSISTDCIPVTPCPDRQPAPLAKVANFIEDVFVQGLKCEKNFRLFADCSKQSSSPVSSSLNLPIGAEQNTPLPGSKTATSSTSGTSPPPGKYEDTTIKAPGDRDTQPLTKPHQAKDNLRSDETEVSCDTKPQVPEELLPSYDRCLSADGRCSSSSVDSLSSIAESDSNQPQTTSELPKPSFNETKTDIKESLSDDCVCSPLSNLNDTKVKKSSISNHKLLSEDLSEILPPPGEGWPVWVYCNRYSARPSSGPRSRRQSRKMQSNDEKRCRTAFTMLQLNKLHMAFESNPYLCEKRRNELARDLQLSESQVKIWFQNRRAKVKKATGTKNQLATLLKEQGLYNHSTTKA